MGRSCTRQGELPAARRLARFDRPLAVGLTIVAVGLTTAGVISYLLPPAFGLIDANTYLAAGERLNAGHSLYFLEAGDRPVNLQNGYALASPPFIAVIWRPLASLGGWTMIPWSIASALGLAWAVSRSWRAHPLAVAVLLLILWTAMIYALGVGNVNGLLMAGTVVTGLRPRWAPVIIGLMGAIKIWPLLLALAAIRSWRATGELAGTLALCGAISLLGAGWEAHVTYLGVLGRLGTYETSLGSLTGLPWLGIAILAGCLPLILAGSYRAAIVASVLGNPAMHLGAWATLLPALAPNRIPLRWRT